MNSIYKTNDNSHTIFSSKYNETYHSMHGAYDESQHIFIEKGISYYDKAHTPSTLSVLELGFGTGLNVLLTALYCEENARSCHYTTIEISPLEKELISQLNYENIIPRKTKLSFIDIHLQKWNSTKQYHCLNHAKVFDLTKMNMDIKNYHTKERFDLIYFDAFSPKTQPELWEYDLLKQMYILLKPEGMLLTYCAKGSVKRDLAKIGFKLDCCDGPKGKREMTRAIKSR